MLTINNAFARCIAYLTNIIYHNMVYLYNIHIIFTVYYNNYVTSTVTHVYMHILIDNVRIYMHPFI